MRDTGLIQMPKRVIKLIRILSPVYLRRILHRRLAHLLDALNRFSRFSRPLPDAIPDRRVMHQPPDKQRAARQVVGQASRKMTPAANRRCPRHRRLQPLTRALEIRRRPYRRFPKVVVVDPLIDFIATDRNICPVIQIENTAIPRDSPAARHNATVRRIVETDLEYASETAIGRTRILIELEPADPPSQVIAQVEIAVGL